MTVHTPDLRKMEHHRHNCRWQEDGLVMITHVPSGDTARAIFSRSIVKNAGVAWEYLLAKLRRRFYGPMPLVRTYVIPDGHFTTDDLETGRCIYDRKIHRNHRGNLVVEQDGA